MAAAEPSALTSWRVRGSYFEACNCEAICPCRSVGSRPGGPSTFGECYGALSWHVKDGHADGVDISDLRAVMSLRYFDRVPPSTPWEVALYIDEDADDSQRAALADIFLGRAGGTVARLYGPPSAMFTSCGRQGSPSSMSGPASASAWSAISRLRPKATPLSLAMSGAESRASTIQAPSCTAASCDRLTRRCATRSAAGATRHSPRTSTTYPAPRSAHSDLGSVRLPHGKGAEGGRPLMRGACHWQVMAALPSTIGTGSVPPQASGSRPCVSIDYTK